MGPPRGADQWTKEDSLAPVTPPLKPIRTPCHGCQHCFSIPAELPRVAPVHVQSCALAIVKHRTPTLDTAGVLHREPLSLVRQPRAAATAHGPSPHGSSWQADCLPSQVYSVRNPCATVARRKSLPRLVGSAASAQLSCTNLEQFWPQKRALHKSISFLHHCMAIEPASSYICVKETCRLTARDTTYSTCQRLTQQPAVLPMLLCSLHLTLYCDRPTLYCDRNHTCLHHCKPAGCPHAEQTSIGRPSRMGCVCPVAVAVTTAPSRA